MCVPVQVRVPAPKYKEILMSKKSSIDYVELQGLQIALQYLKSLKDPTDDELSVIRWIPDRLYELINK